MRTKRFRKKMALKKETITKLSGSMNSIKGGFTRDGTCLPFQCPTEISFCCPIETYGCVPTG